MEEYKGYVGAPYNFVGISKKVNWKDKDQLQPHNVIDLDLKSGTIRYEIEAVTPVFVSEGKREGGKAEAFYKTFHTYEKGTASDQVIEEIESWRNTKGKKKDR